MNWLDSIKRKMEAKLTSIEVIEELGFDTYSCSLDDSAYAHHFEAWRNNGIVTEENMQNLSPTDAEKQLFNRSGYAREFALLVLVAQDHKQSFNAVITRLNDYVKKNRAIATKTVLAWLTEVSIEELLVALPALMNLQRQSRTTADVIIAALKQRLFDPANQIMLLQAIEHSNHKIGALCWQLCNQFFNWNVYEKISFAVKCKDISIKHAMCSEVSKLTASELLSFIPQLQKIKLMQLRREVLLQLRRNGLLDEVDCIKTAIWDKSYGIRWMGRLWAKEVPQFLYDEYHDALTGKLSISRMLFALEGLRELNKADGIELCLSVLNFSHISVRRRALETLCKLDKKNINHYLNHCIRDQDIQMLKTCFQISFRESSLFDTALLRSLAEVRKNESIFFTELLRYANTVLGWQGIEYAALLSCADFDTKNKVKNELHSFLRTWSRSQLYQTISNEKFQEIRTWLNDNELNALGDIGNEIRFLFKTTENRFKT
ncbi:hypothetical protein [Undibacterium flavidum]|uniref:HEAT repeat protein n=1 Tax=Undibacterium flavidum TaxID=2762297 RepID=A0ABR6Y7Q4_9BURK|nr:hypothetical protein [Undibacterium flavidum]MBC3872643.1 hypothetical protein [Undibacterium flavidum]